MIFESHGRVKEIKKKTLERVAKAAFSVLGDREGEISLAFVTDEKMADYNFRYRNKQGSTDVLSFVLDEAPLIGQILICYTKAKAQAEEYGVSLEEEITRLLVHGVCHLYGFDHETDKEEQEMKEKENNILEKVK